MFIFLNIVLVSSSMLEDDELLYLDDINFATQVENKEALILFYDPFCPASNLAYYEFALAAKSASKNSPLTMAKMNLFSNIHIATAYKISTVPKIMYYKGNSTFIYHKEINAKNVAELIESLTYPRLKTLQASQINDFMIPEIVSFLLLDDEDSKLSKKIAVSLRERNPVNIAHCSDRALAEKLGLGWGKLYALNSYHGIKDELSEFTFESITDFVLKRDLHKALPLISSYDYVIEQGLPAVYLFRNESEGKNFAKVINETLKHLGDFRIVFADLYENIMFSRIIGLPATEQPCLMLIEPIGNNLFKYMSKSKEISKDSILALIKDWKQNKALRYYKTAPQKTGEINGNDFKNYFENTVKDTLVHFYAKWCEHCKKLETVLEKVESELPDLNIIRIDAEDNEVPEHIIDEYPTLKFYSPVTKKWFTFLELRRGVSKLETWERIVEFVKVSRRDKRSRHSNSDL